MGEGDGIEVNEILIWIIYIFLTSCSITTTDFHNKRAVNIVLFISFAY